MGNEIADRQRDLDRRLFMAATYVDGDDAAGSKLAGQVRVWMVEAKDEIERLEAENARLREALAGVEAVYRDWDDNRIWGHQAMMLIAGKLPGLTQPGDE